MRIITAGCWRSGTTALYNLVRVMCEENGHTYACFDDTYDEEKGTKYDFEIVKVHKYSGKWINWTDLIFTIWREPNEVLASMRRFYVDQDEESILIDYGRGLTWFGLYNKYTGYEANFNQLSRSPEKLARQLAGKIGLSIDEKEIVKRFNAIKPPKSGVDPVTLLHSNHITSK